MSVLAIVLLFAAALFLLGAPVAGVLLFSPERAKRVRIAENQSEQVVAQVKQLHVWHPEMIKGDRLDRHDTYIWLSIGLWLYGWGVVAAASPNSNLALSWGTQQALGLCLIVGPTITLVGASLGVQLGRLHISRKVAHNLVSELLGDDIRLPYALGWFGLLSIAVSMFFYAGTVIAASTPYALGVLLSGVSVGIGFMCITLGCRYLVRIRRYVKARGELIAEAVARIEAQA